MYNIPAYIQLKPLKYAQLRGSVDLSALLGNFALAAKMDHKTKDVDAQIPKDIKSVVESDQFEKVIDDKFAGFGKPDWMN
ncbi:hypothetical protein [Peribacillus sp. N1]